VAHLLAGAPLCERAAYLELASRQNGAMALADRIAQLRPDRPWSTLWARWRSASDHFTAGRHDGGVYAVAVSELDGRPVIVSGGRDGTVRVWELADGSPLGDPLTGHDGVVHAVAVGELDGRPVIVSGGEDGTVRVWELADGSPLTEARMTNKDASWFVRRVAALWVTHLLEEDEAPAE
jgi:WD40 repeat protein